MNISKILEEKEKSVLIQEACFSYNSGRRKITEKKDDIRTPFMVDRDRIIHCKSFRRLKHKTQVFIKAFADHYRTRLTHTLEVSQIARTIGSGIGLNNDLIEAIALGHDIGHVAFAHNGEEVLNELIPNGFKHNLNSIRILTEIENNGQGLNLTDEVLNGILTHSGFSKSDNISYTLEGQVVRYSDKIAYVNHDIDDSLRAGILKQSDFPMDCFGILGETSSQRINTLVTDCIFKSLKNIKSGDLKISLSKEIEDALSTLRNFMFKEVYKGNKLKEEREKARFVLDQLFMHLYNNIDKLPSFYLNIAEREGKHQGVSDYIAGMSDDFCLYTFNKIFIPKMVLY